MPCPRVPVRLLFDAGREGPIRGAEESTEKRSGQPYLSRATSDGRPTADDANRGLVGRGPINVRFVTRLERRRERQPVRVVRFVSPVVLNHARRSCRPATVGPPACCKTIADRSSERSPSIRSWRRRRTPALRPLRLPPPTPRTRSCCWPFGRRRKTSRWSLLRPSRFRFPNTATAIRTSIDRILNRAR